MVASPWWWLRIRHCTVVNVVTSALQCCVSLRAVCSGFTVVHCTMHCAQCSGTTVQWHHTALWSSAQCSAGPWPGCRATPGGKKPRGCLVFVSLQSALQSLHCTRCTGGQCSAAKYRVVQRSGVEWRAVQYSAVQCSGVQWSGVQWIGLERPNCTGPPPLPAVCRLA